MATSAAEEEEDEEELLIQNIEDELNEPITDPIKESTKEYYVKSKDKVCYNNIEIS